MQIPEVTHYGDSLTGDDLYDGVLHRYNGAEHILLEKHPAQNDTPYREHTIFSTPYGPDEVRGHYESIFGIPAEIISEHTETDVRQTDRETSINIGPRGVLIVRQPTFNLGWYAQGAIFHDRPEQAARITMTQKIEGFDLRHIALIRALADASLFNSIDKLF